MRTFSKIVSVQEIVIQISDEGNCLSEDDIELMIQALDHEMPELRELSIGFGYYLPIQQGSWSGNSNWNDKLLDKLGDTIK